MLKLPVFISCTTAAAAIGAFLLIPLERSGRTQHAKLIPTAESNSSSLESGTILTATPSSPPDVATTEEQFREQREDAVLDSNRGNQSAIARVGQTIQARLVDLEAKATQERVREIIAAHAEPSVVIPVIYSDAQISSSGILMPKPIAPANRQPATSTSGRTPNSSPDPAQAKIDARMAQHQDDFVNSIGGPTHNPSDPAFTPTWQTAQNAADDKFRRDFGDAAFIGRDLQRHQRSAK